MYTQCILCGQDEHPYVTQPERKLLTSHMFLLGSRLVRVCRFLDVND